MMACLRASICPVSVALSLGIVVAFAPGCDNGDRVVPLRPAPRPTDIDEAMNGDDDADDDDDDHDDHDHDHAPAEPPADALATHRQAPLLQAREGLDLTAPGAPPTAVTPAPIPQAYCQINVNGVNHDTETDYIPHVIQCENGGANLEALKAQAIAARSVAYYAMAENGTICDSQSCQVYSCNANPQAIHYQAAQETAGQYLSFNNTIKGRVLTYAFYVAGDKNQTAACKGVDINAGTEKFVTYNEGKSWTDVKETTLGFQFKDPNAYGYGQNRGCMSQWSARCLENSKGYDATKILRYFYGDDIEIQQAEGPCVSKPNEPPQGALEAAACPSIRGWAFDPDVGEGAIAATVSLGGPLDDPGAHTFKLTADRNRPDLCDPLGSCDHGFELPTPRSLMDGLARPVHAYAHDDEGDAPVELAESPRELLCPPPPLPEGVRRPVGAPMIDAWGFDPFWQMAVVDDGALAARPLWQALPDAPQLIQAEGQPEVWLVDLGFRRWVPSPEVAAAWGFDLGAVAIWPPAMVEALPQGPDVRASVFLVRGDAPTIYLLDDLFCPEEGGVDDPLCPPDGETTEGTGGSTGGGTGGTDGVTASGSGTGGSSSDGGGTDASAGGTSGEGSATGGPGLPPGYGEGPVDEGCGCAASSPLQASLWLLLAAPLRRRRRRKNGAHSPRNNV